MKKFFVLALAIAFVLSGCGCREARPASTAVQGACGMATGDIEYDFAVAYIVALRTQAESAKDDRFLARAESMELNLIREANRLHGLGQFDLEQFYCAIGSLSRSSIREAT